VVGIGLMSDAGVWWALIGPAAITYLILYALRADVGTENDHRSEVRRLPEKNESICAEENAYLVKLID
jgi:hypothetical protein